MKKCTSFDKQKGTRYIWALTVNYHKIIKKNKLHHSKQQLSGHLMLQNHTENKLCHSKQQYTGYLMIHDVLLVISCFELLVVLLVISY